MRRKQLTWIPVILSLCAVMVLPACGAAVSPQANAAQAISVKAIKLGQTNESGLSGKVIPDQEVKVVSKASGKVLDVKVNEGSVVKKGDVLVQLETDDLSQQLKQAESGVIAAQAKLADTQAGARSQEIQGLESAVQSAKAANDQIQAATDTAKSAFDLAQKNYNRLRNMYESSSTVSKDDMDKGTFEFDKAKSAYDQAQAQLQSSAAQVTAAKAKLDLARSGPTGNTVEALQAEVNRLNAGLELASSAFNNAAITAPMDGIIVKRSIQPGEMAQPGVTLLNLVKMDQVQIELSVPDSLIGKLKSGADVDVKISNLPDRSFAGKLNFVSPVSNANSSTFPVKVTVDNKDGLILAGMMAEVHMKEAGQNRMEIPKAALVKKDNKNYIYMIQDKTAKAVEVTTQDKNQDWVYLQDNASVKAGQQIIINPTDALTDGSTVKVE
ncbi:efflux RND transporter periplasmic adaptor subunit [Paenibacillus radicis (ex Xue et al. 2023)]|uniref:Efflux RND transporter periplasmic adaptor subunit n=1 Tax=Paenibacillus radicis (ex Xue et al. 2023) TaxID=2972489 RepID=A0ABT1Y937_9BACL|nr:efflux RND transporter periplasmic adaptor subunit [Paenibacillus radicis (ex Xue et al. 2023)]MCR8629710.1 efflux RND transporter periplasmic adaptor subunit [Paenibacillus radicis (ex Xue et al. 2023)]